MFKVSSTAVGKTPKRVEWVFELTRLETCDCKSNNVGFDINAYLLLHNMPSLLRTLWF